MKINGKRLILGRDSVTRNGGVISFRNLTFREQDEAVAVFIVINKLADKID